MPHLQFEINKQVEDNKKEEFVKNVREAFATLMGADEGHIAISIRELDPLSLSIGRVPSGEYVCLMHLDIREGRSFEQKRDLALRFMAIVNNYFEIDLKNQHITYSEHRSEDFHLSEKYIATWANDEAAMI